MEQIGPRHFGGHRTTKHDKKSEKEHRQIPRRTRHHLLRLVDGLPRLRYQKRLLERMVRPLRSGQQGFRICGRRLPRRCADGRRKSDRPDEGWQVQEHGRFDRIAADQTPGSLPARHALSGSRHLQLPPVKLLAESGRRGDSVPQRMGRHAFARPPRMERYGMVRTTGSLFESRKGRNGQRDSQGVGERQCPQLHRRLRHRKTRHGTFRHGTLRRQPAGRKATAQRRLSAGLRTEPDFRIKRLETGAPHPAIRHAIIPYSI